MRRHETTDTTRLSVCQVCFKQSSNLIQRYFSKQKHVLQNVKLLQMLFIYMYIDLSIYIYIFYKALHMNVGTSLTHWMSEQQQHSQNSNN